MTGATPVTTSGTARTVSGSYTTLFSVAIEHDYYNADGGACPGLAVTPTPACAALMRTLGMIFKDQGTGFAVLIEQARAGALIAWLSARAQAAPEGHGCWAWLSFQLVATDLNFVGITNLPIATNPTTQKFHVSNLQTVMPGASISLGDGGGIDASALYPVTGAGLSVPLATGESASLCDLSGAPVTAKTTATPGAIAFDIGVLPDGIYTVAYADAAGESVVVPPGGAAAPGYIYAPSKPQALGQLDLLIAQPRAGLGDPSAFPVTALAMTATSGPPAIATVSLVLPFRARDTFWRYYIVSQNVHGALTPDLAISGTGATFAKSTETLPNGDQAVVFAADAALPLQQLSSYRFSLSGQRQATNGARDAISVAVLPTAPATPVWPAPSGDGLVGSSEIYVYV